MEVSLSLDGLQNVEEVLHARTIASKSWRNCYGRGSSLAQRRTRLGVSSVFNASSADVGLPKDLRRGEALPRLGGHDPGELQLDIPQFPYDSPCGDVAHAGIHDSRPSDSRLEREAAVQHRCTRHGEGGSSQGLRWNQERR